MLARLIVVFTSVLGLFLGWYLSTALAERAISVQFIFHRILAALIGAASAGGAFYLWKTRKKTFRALALFGLGLLAILGLGFLMTAI